MKKLFEKDEVWFAVLWIIIYVVGFGNADLLSEAMGVPKLLTVFLGIVMTAILFGFVRTNQMFEYVGLCKTKRTSRDFLYFVPLVVISSVNLWNGVTLNVTILETIFYMISMCFVGFLEEVIFRGFLFKGMSKTNVIPAIVISSLAFGMGHIVNLLMGAPLFDTMLQLIYASAIGFCYTVVFYVGGSIWPCILSHAFVNATSVFAIESSGSFQLMVAIVQTLVGVGYGVWLLKLTGRRHN